MHQAQTETVLGISLRGVYLCEPLSRLAVDFFLELEDERRMIW